MVSYALLPMSRKRIAPGVLTRYKDWGRREVMLTLSAMWRRSLRKAVCSGPMVGQGHQGDQDTGRGEKLRAGKMYEEKEKEVWPGLRSGVMEPRVNRPERPRGTKIAVKRSAKRHSLQSGRNEIIDWNAG